MSAMHKPDAAPPSVQRIMDAIAGCEASADELREMIAAALLAGTVNVVMDREHGGLTFAPAKRQAVLLTDEQIENGRKQVFSTDNPFCPCDYKTMRKAARWAEAAALAANGLEVRRG